MGGRGSDRKKIPRGRLLELRSEILSGMKKSRGVFRGDRIGNNPVAPGVRFEEVREGCCGHSVESEVRSEEK